MTYNNKINIAVCLAVISLISMVGLVIITDRFERKRTERLKIENKAPNVKQLLY